MNTSYCNFALNVTNLNLNVYQSDIDTRVLKFDTCDATHMLVALVSSTINVKILDITLIQESRFGYCTTNHHLRMCKPIYTEFFSPNGFNDWCPIAHGISTRCVNRITRTPSASCSLYLTAQSHHHHPHLNPHHRSYVSLKWSLQQTVW